MAKKIRFPLEMENGIEVRSMEELRDNFSLAKVLEYFENGKLVTWLRDRYANDMADAVEALDKNEPELARKLSGIFDVPYDEKAEEKLKEAEERAERLKRLKEFTDDEQIWDNVDYVAFEQDELYDLLDEDAETIYLCGKRFSIPLSKSGVRYIGVNNPTAVIDSKVEVDWNDKKISIEGVTFDEKYQVIIDSAHTAKKIQDKNNAEVKENYSTKVVKIDAYTYQTYLHKDKTILKSLLPVDVRDDVRKNYKRAKTKLEKLNYDIDIGLEPNSNLFMENK